MSNNDQKFDDRTSAIDARQLKAAQREAVKHERSEVKAASRAGAFPVARERVFPWFLVLLAGAAGGGYYYYGDTINERFFSPVPELSDVAPGGLVELRKAARYPTASAFVLSTAQPTTPKFFILGPEGATSVSLVLTPDAATVAAEHPRTIRFPVELAKRFGRTPAVELDPGYYDLSIEAADGKTILSRRLFLGGSGAPDASYQLRLDGIHQAAALRHALIESLRAALEATNAKAAEFAKIARKPARVKAWAAFHASWIGQYPPEPTEASLYEIWTSIRSLHEAQMSGAAPNDALARDIEQKLSAAGSR